MEEKKYIEKWLRGELTPNEEQEFEQLDSYTEVTRINAAAKQFKAPNFDTNASYNTFKTQLAERNTMASNNWKPWLLRIAAIVVIALCSYTFLIATSNDDITVQTVVANKQEIVLPDTSEVLLNAISTLEYNETSWKDAREVALDGEAFFKVAKGQRFDVNTANGIVSVLGTQFNVKNRNNLFKVSCYEGLVQVTYKDQLYKVPAGSTFLVRNSVVQQSTTTLEAPEWTRAKSAFESAPYSEVLAELERQYDMKVLNKTIIDADLKFTGSFTHNDLDTALKSITIPVQLKFSVKNKQVTISK